MAFDGFAAAARQIVGKPDSYASGRSARSVQFRAFGRGGGSVQFRAFGRGEGIGTVPLLILAAGRRSPACRRWVAQQP